MDEEPIKSHDNIFMIAEVIRGLKILRNNNVREPGQDPYRFSGEFFAIIEYSKENNCYIQFVTDHSSNRLMVDISSVYYNNYKLSKKKISWLLKHGWSLPDDSEPNYYKKIGIRTEKDIYLAAAEIVTTFIMIYDFMPSDPLTIETDECRMEPGEKKLLFADRKIRPQFGQPDNPKKDKKLQYLLEKDSKREIPVIEAVVDISLIKPFCSFKPSKERLDSVRKQFIAALEEGRPNYMLTYEKGKKLIMSDDYHTYYLYLEEGIKKVPCFILGETKLPVEKIRYYNVIKDDE